MIFVLILLGFPFVPLANGILWLPHARRRKNGRASQTFGQGRYRPFLLCVAVKQFIERHCG